jgi:hypothetical protein
MKKIYAILMTSSILASGSLFSQQRYIDEVFTDVTVSTDVPYGSNYNVYISPPTPTSQPLVMDVYEPMGDSITDRPLIVLAHAGSFLPECTQNTLPLGTKQDSAMVEMCMQFAKRGYVAVSMDYRLGWNPLGNADDRAGTIMTAVYLAYLDMKACVRYMKINSSTYGIDENKVVVGGSNSGGYVALAYGALNDTTELQYLKFLHSSTGDPYVDQDLWGDFEGDNGTAGFFNYNNPGASSDVQLILNLGGAIGDTLWQEAGELPIISFHGEADSLTPINSKTVVVAATGQPVVEVSGGRHISRRANNLGNQNFYDQFFNDAYTQSAQSKTSYPGFMPFFGPANGYEPWAWYNENSPCIASPGSGTGSAANPLATKSKALAYIDTIMGFFCPRAVQVLGLPGNTVGINNPEELSERVLAYPNPTNDVLNISSDFEVLSAAIYNVDGAVVWSDINERNRKFAVNVSSFEKGFYILRLETERGTINKKIVIN